MDAQLLDSIHLNKEELQHTIQHLPDTFTAADLLEHIFLEGDVKIALQQIKEGKTHTHADVKEIIESWRK